MAAYDLAFKMQTEAPEVFDLSKESQETRELYGIGKEPTDDYGRRCLLARRLVEKGVRFVCVVSGGGPRQFAVGRARRHRREPPAHGGADRSAGGGADQGFEAARPARFDAGAVGRRVRTFAGSAGQQRAAITTISASRCGWRAAGFKGGRVVRRNGRDRAAGGRESACISATFTPRSFISSG